MTFSPPEIQLFPQPNKRRGRWWKVPLIVLGSLVALFFTLGLVGIALGTLTGSDQAPVSTATADQSAAKASAQAELDRLTKEFGEAADKAVRDGQQKTDQDMSAQGWEPMGGLLYYSVMPAEQVDCGRTPCSGFSVVTQMPAGCPNGIYLQASFLVDGNTSVGSASEMTAPLAQGQQAVFRLFDTSHSATAVEVTKMNCR